MGAPNPKPSKVTVTVGGKPLVLYVKPADVAPFIGTQTPDASGTPVTKPESVKSHARRRYIGGPTANVQGHTRSRVTGDRLPGPTLPGNNAWMERIMGSPPVRKVEQITYVGTFDQLKTYCKAEAVIAFWLRSPWGEKFNIPLPTP